jgi:hypothetical protein
LNFFSPTSGTPIKSQIFGIKGAGKSLFIASLFSMLYDSERFHIPTEQGLKSTDSPNDVTREIVEIIPQNRIIQKVLGKNTPIGVTFKDAPGIDAGADSFDENNQHKRYNDDHIRYLVHGVLPTGFKLEGKREGDDEENLQFTSLKKDINREYIENLDQHMIEQRPHSVVFCLSGNSLQDSGMANRIRTMLDKFTQEGIPLIVCLTQMDKPDPNLNANPLLSSEAVDRMLEDAATKLGINVDNIIYSVSYGRTPEGKKLFEYDKLHFKNLEKIQRKAEDYATKLREEGNELTGNALVARNRFRHEYEN